MATLQVMRQRVSRKLDQPLVDGDIPESGVFWTQAEVNDWINEGRRQVWAEIAEVEGPTLELDATGTYTANSREVNVSGTSGAAGGIFNIAEPVKLLSLHDISSDATGIGTLLPIVPYNELSTLMDGFGDPIRTTPYTRRVASWRGSNPMRLVLFPRPSSAVTLRLGYVPNPTDLSDTAAPTDLRTPFELPEIHHDLLVMYAVVQAKKKEEDSSWQDDFVTYTEQLRRMIATMDERQSVNSRTVVVTDFNEYDGGTGY